MPRTSIMFSDGVSPSGFLAEPKSDLEFGTNLRQTSTNAEQLRPPKSEWKSPTLPMKTTPLKLQKKPPVAQPQASDYSLSKLKPQFDPRQATSANNNSLEYKLLARDYGNRFVKEHKFAQSDGEEIDIIQEFMAEQNRKMKEWSERLIKLRSKALRGEVVSEGFRGKLGKMLYNLGSRINDARERFAEEFSGMLCDELTDETKLRKAVASLLTYSLGVGEDNADKSSLKGSGSEIGHTMLAKRATPFEREMEYEDDPSQQKDKRDAWELTKPIWRPKPNYFTENPNSRDEKHTSLTIRIPDTMLDPLSPSKGPRILLQKPGDHIFSKDYSPEYSKTKNTVGTLVSARKTAGLLSQGSVPLGTTLVPPSSPVVLDPPQPNLPISLFTWTTPQIGFHPNSPSTHLQSTSLGVPTKDTVGDAATKSIIRDQFTKQIREYLVDGKEAGNILGGTRCVIAYPRGVWTVILSDKEMAQFIPEAIRIKEGSEIRPIQEMESGRNITGAAIASSGQHNANGQAVTSATAGNAFIQSQLPSINSWVLTPPKLRIYDETQVKEFTMANGLIQLSSLARFLDQLHAIDGKYCLVKTDGKDYVFVACSQKIFIIDMRVLDPANGQIIPELLLELPEPELLDFDVIVLPNGCFRIAYLASFEENLLFIVTIPPKPTASSSESGSNFNSHSANESNATPTPVENTVQSVQESEPVSSPLVSDSASKVDPDQTPASPVSIGQSSPLTELAPGASSEVLADSENPKVTGCTIQPRPRWYKLDEAEFLDKDLWIGFNHEMSKDFTISFRKLIFVDESIVAVGVCRINQKAEKIQYLETAFLKVAKSRIKFKKILSALCPMHKPTKGDSKEAPKDYQRIDIDVISLVNPTPVVKEESGTKSLGKLPSVRNLNRLKFVQHLDLENNFRALFPVPDFSSCLESDSEHESCLDIVESEVIVFWDHTPGLLEIATEPISGDIFITSEEGKFFLMTSGCPKTLAKDLLALQSSVGCNMKSLESTLSTAKMLQQPSEKKSLPVSLIVAEHVTSPVTEETPTPISEMDSSVGGANILGSEHN